MLTYYRSYKNNFYTLSIFSTVWQIKHKENKSVKKKKLFPIVTNAATEIYLT